MAEVSTVTKYVAEIFLSARTELTAKRLPVRLSTERSRDLVPGPFGGPGLAHGYLYCLLSDTARVGRSLDQLFNGRSSHATNYGTICGIDRADKGRGRFHLAPVGEA